MKEHERRSGSEEGRSRDVLPYLVFAAGMVVLIVSGIIGWFFLFEGKTFDPGQAVTAWMEDLARQGRDLLSRGPGGILSGEDRGREAGNHLEKGRVHYSRDRLKEALEEFGEAVRLDPNNPEAHYWTGRVHLKLMRYEDALYDFRTAARLKPDYREAHDHLGWLYERKKSYDEALFHLSRSIQLDQGNAWAYYHRAVVLYRRGEVREALGDARKACELKSREGCMLVEELKGKQAGVQSPPNEVKP
jgi:tetratricopeptide (TPR) repeat protein